MIDWIPDMQSRSTISAGNSKTATDRKAILSTLWDLCSNELHLRRCVHDDGSVR